MAGWITKRDDRPKPWLARFTPRGGGRTVSKAFELKREAAAWLVEQRSLYNAGEYVEAARGAVTFGDYAKAWRKRRDVKDSTRAFYKSLTDNQLDVFDDRPLDALTDDDIEDHLVGLRDDYSPRTVRGAATVLSAVLEDAVDRRVLTRSPMPSQRRLAKVLPASPKPRNPNTRFLTREEVDRLAEAIEPTYRAMVLVGAFGGLRWGEAAALSPVDIDFPNRLLRVHHNLAQPDRGTPYRDPSMKTDSSKRTIALGGLADVLEAHVAEYATNDWLFHDSKGGPLRDSNWRRRVWLPAAEKAGLTPPPLRFHDLRHTCAAWLIGQGESVLVLQTRLGHSTPSTTLNIYGALLPGVDEAAADKLTAGL